MESKPLISIGIPVFNGEKLLGELLENLNQQTFDSFEIIICNNASTDRTEEICLDHAARDPRIRYYRNERNLGANPNFNKVFSLATAPLFKWAAHDDLYEAEYLEKCVKCLSEHPDVVLADSDRLCVDAQRRPFKFGDDPSSYIDPRSGETIWLDPVGLAEDVRPERRLWDVLFRMGCNLQIFGVIRREALSRTGLLRNFYGTDKLVLAELALLGRFMQIPERLFVKRYHENMSWVLSLREQRRWSTSTDVAYSRRLRQLASFLPIPFGKGLSAGTVAVCLSQILLLGPKVMIRASRDEAERKRLIARWQTGDRTAIGGSERSPDDACARQVPGARIK